MRLLRNISISLGKEPDLLDAILRKLCLNENDIAEYSIRRRALDARQPNHLRWQYTVNIRLNDETISHADLLEIKRQKPSLFPVHKLFDRHPFIIGAGPAGLFCALEMVKKGLQPWIFDQGDEIELRENKVKKFWTEGILDAQSNIQFGEGGAGTFSDGKLTARNQDFYTQKVFEYLIRFGADADISIEAHPHLGTDKLKEIIYKIRKYLTDRGCRFFWRHTLTDLKINDNKIAELTINNEIYSPEITVLAVGNASRGLLRTLVSKIALQSRSVAMGVRIEHEQDYINKLFYGDKTDISLTGAAEYRIKAKAGKHSVFSFCMCPGGIVVNASSQPEHLVTNGMSWSARKGKYANSALVTPVAASSISDPLAVLELQETIENRCWQISSDFCAPAQKAIDFINHKISVKLPKTTFLPGVIPANLPDILPAENAQALAAALAFWNKRFKGFAQNGILIAPETRTSSPVRMIRDPRLYSSQGAQNLFPIGEGSGYASGIISSAADGIKLCALMEY